MSSFKSEGESMLQRMLPNMIDKHRVISSTENDEVVVHPMKFRMMVHEI